MLTAEADDDEAAGRVRAQGAGLARPRSGPIRPGDRPRSQAARVGRMAQRSHFTPPADIARHPSADPVEVQVLSSA